MYDIIGDIHGQASTLEQLLLKMDYRLENNVYTHPNRKVVFVGDFIDSKGEHKKTLEICRPMVEAGSALAVMGNHEFNAICYATLDKDGGYLRPHNEKNINDHAEFIAEYPFHSPAHLDVIDWFKSLPLFLDLDDLRIIHAVWHHASFTHTSRWLNNNNCLLPEAYTHASDKRHPLYMAIERLLKGIEMKLPDGLSFKDKRGNQRTSARIQWWNEQATRWNNATIGTDSAVLPDLPLPGQTYRYHDKVPLFVGHYWMSGDPQPLSDHVACVDYSVARPGGKLAAYRWSGEQKLDKSHFIWVERGK